MHSHNCDEHVTVLEGEAEVCVAGEVTRLTRFDTTYIRGPGLSCRVLMAGRRAAPAWR
ncbi:cupin domain-containing protein [Nonomuraea turkmeniaca]|uniref:Cupin domain-containing protein n=2 Tax=Nonomuraea turkmeniaca TaxID=103838 RepID=A0A5S4G9A1_9ACTN|nr:cupin domain-containing protein [Nonomuraea turkmeniaca]